MEEWEDTNMPYNYTCSGCSCPKESSKHCDELEKSLDTEFFPAVANNAITEEEVEEEWEELEEEDFDFNDEDNDFEEDEEECDECQCEFCKNIEEYEEDDEEC